MLISVLGIGVLINVKDALVIALDVVVLFAIVAVTVVVMWHEEVIGTLVSVVNIDVLFKLVDAVITALEVPVPV